MEAEVVRSGRRRKTIQAHEVDGVLRVHVPASLSKAEEEHWVGVMVNRFEKRRVAATADIEGRATALSRRFSLPTPTSVRWVSNQDSRWGSCTPVDGTIRLSDRMAEYPKWVIDYVLVHELAHLVHPRHDAAFYEVVNQFEMAERARGFLLAKGGESPD